VLWAILYRHAGAALLFTRRKRFPPGAWGKASTFAQIACAPSALLRDAWHRPGLESVASALVWPVLPADFA